MSSKPLAPTCYPFITLLWRDICGKVEQREGENEPLVGGSICGLTVIYTSLTAHLEGGGTGRLTGRQTPGALDANYPRGGCGQKGD